MHALILCKTMSWKNYSNCFTNTKPTVLCVTFVLKSIFNIGFRIQMLTLQIKKKILANSSMKLID